MFLSKKKKVAPDEPRSELQQTARTHSSPGQRILGIFVGVVGAVVILGGVAWKYVWPAVKGTPSIQQAQQPTPTDAAKLEPKLNVPLDLDSAPSRQENVAGGMFPQSQSYNPDTQPSAPPHGGNQESSGGRGAPPGMTGQPIGQQIGAGAEGAEERELAAKRKMSGDLGDFGEPAARAQRKRYEAMADDDDDGEQAAIQQEVARRQKAAMKGQSETVRQGSAAPIAAGPAVQEGGGNALASQLKPISTPDGEVRRIPHPHLTVQKGEPLTCTLDTAIQTDVVGFVECITDYPLMSMDGKVVLAERGTRIQGEYSRSVAAGSNGIFVLWTKGTTPAPNHVEFSLLSPGTDKLGRAGIQGDVDNKFMQRYGGALMFSVLQDVSTIATSKAGTAGSSNVFLLPSTQSAGQNAVAELLKQGSEVKASLYRNQGDTVSITIARYIDFSGVYRLRPAKVR